MKQWMLDQNHASLFSENTASLVADFATSLIADFATLPILLHYLPITRT